MQKTSGQTDMLVHMRPNIAFVVSMVSQHMHSPRVAHMEVYKILRQSNRSLGRGLYFKRRSLKDKRFTYRYYMLVWGNLVTWRTMKQIVVARSIVKTTMQCLIIPPFQGMLTIPWVGVGLDDRQQRQDVA
ncbi:hypothetical protein OSB04_016801 [Centaurea solstitialis]|uniref:Mitochondrial protein n=1 Tax=Centaurea solstitialis TaxID=347529 RepID=A0AA38WLF4_9ASTR|nr:hypothetical protein OSB04_016801 [Centaurea solstitialis]